MGTKMDQMKNNPYVLIVTAIALAFGGGKVAVVTQTDEDQIKQQKVDSLTTELTKVTTEMLSLKETIIRVESDSKSRNETTNKRLEKLEQKQDKILEILLNLKK